jgi:hypothetical protein
MAANLPTSLADEFIANATAKPASCGNLIFAIDATGSRERTWDTAVQLQSEMFREVAGLGALNTQLIYFRSYSECKASNWVSDPMQLEALMRRVRCDTGETQINRILTHAAKETARRKINAMAYIGDCCEEQREQLTAPARRLSNLEVPVFMFQEGDDRDVRSLFREIAELTGGSYHQLNHDSAAQLAELLKAVAVFSVGGVPALEQQGTKAAKLLLNQIR